MSITAPEGARLRLHRRHRGAGRKGHQPLSRGRRGRADHPQHPALRPEPVQHGQRRRGDEALGRAQEDRRPGRAPN
ncbi:hypothetical protein ACRAWD_19415 [Caulobacter segnis]